MSDETDEQQAAIRGGGASVHVHDGRFSKLLRWGWTALGMAAVSGSWIAANNLYQLNLTVARGIDRNSEQDRQLADHEGRLRQIERDVSTLEGKVYRGVQGYEEPVPPRGPTRGH